MSRFLVALVVTLPILAIADPASQLSDDGPMQRHFAADAHLFLPGSTTTGALPPAKLAYFTKGEGASFDAFKVGKVTTGTRGAATWFLAEVVQPWEISVDCPVGARRCKRSRTLRLSELMVEGKVVALHVDDPKRNQGADADDFEPLEITSSPGPLAKLVVDPAAIAKSWLDDPKSFVIGTEVAEKAIGPAASKKLLASWSKLTLAIEGQPRELVKGDWGYVAANVVWTAKGKKTQLRATLYAILVDGAWKVAGVHYSLPYKRLFY